ncbi:MAG TPA: hypothetical protein VG389_09215 [Myxococcota bacterium]|jgi:hypothetical protein|nr:hypothetical protein [Myxococcota bacterium]
MKNLLRLELSAAAALLAVGALAGSGCGPHNDATDSGGGPAMCGNGMVETGEDCDPPVSGMCTTMCTFFPVCGNGRVEVGEECDPPDGMTCNGMCHTVTVVSPNLGAPCTTNEDCNAGGLAAQCQTEANGFPGGLCIGLGCATDSDCAAPTCGANGLCPDAVTTCTSAADCPTSTCVGFTDGTTACYPDCTPSPTSVGCRPDMTTMVAYGCFPLGTFDPTAGACLPGCVDDAGCITGFSCETTTHVCYPNHPAAAAAPGDTCTVAGGTCSDNPLVTCAGDPDCSGTCNRPAGTCTGDPLMGCTADTDCAATCNLTFGTCAFDGAACTSLPGSCGVHACDTIAGTCMGTTTVACTTDADCEVCNLTFGGCSGSPATICMTDAMCQVCNYPLGACTDDASSCAVDGDCLDTCNLSAGGCAVTAAACTTDADCIPGIGDPCATDDDCPEFARCRLSTAFPGGFCTIYYCGSFPGLPQFDCPAGSVCPAAEDFNGGTLNFCVPECTMNTSDPSGECDANRGDDNNYICHERVPDGSATGLSDFFDTDAVPGFCSACVGYWADDQFCPMP